MDINNEQTKKYISDTCMVALWLSNFDANPIDIERFEKVFNHITSSIKLSENTDDISEKNMMAMDFFANKFIPAFDNVTKANNELNVLMKQFEYNYYMSEVNNAELDE